MLKKRIHEIASVRVRYGCERIFTLLRREGWKDNHKRVHRLYKEEGLNLRSKRPRRSKTAAHRLDRIKFTEKDLPVDEEKRSLYEMGKIMFLNNGYVEIGMDHFALKNDSLYKAVEEGTLHRNFMGYTDSYTKLMIGLGVSSIGDTWYTFAQNVKVVEKYYELINKQQLPIFKGHILKNEDLIIRKHILNIMCKFETSWHHEEQQCEYVYSAVDRLIEMEKDNLIELSPGHLKVKKSGYPFVRNICMAFDAKLWRNVPQSQLFSSVI